MEDELVPYAVVSDDALLYLTVLPFNGKVEKPFLEGGLGSTLNLLEGTEFKVAIYNFCKLSAVHSTPLTPPG